MTYSSKRSHAMCVGIVSLGFCASGWASTCVDWVVPTTPASEFSIAEQVLVHRATGLEWGRCSLGQRYQDGVCTGEARGYTFHDATSAAEASDHAGHNDWRLPTRSELRTIVEIACYYPAINTSLFPQTPVTGFWTSSIDPEDGRVWVVGFANGYIMMTDLPGYNRVRLVRTSDQ